MQDPDEQPPGGRERSLTHSWTLRSGPSSPSGRELSKEVSHAGKSLYF